MEYISKAVDLIGYIFELVNKILAAVNGDESGEIEADLSETKDMVDGIAGAVQNFADQVETLK